MEFKDVKEDIRRLYWEIERLNNSLFEYVYENKRKKVEKVNAIGVRLNEISDKIIKLTSE